MPILTEKLQELKNLHEQGLITTDAYSEAQRALLATQLPAASPNTARRKPKLFYATILILGFCVLGLLGWYRIADRDSKDLINQLVSETGVGKQLVPWSDRADTVLRGLIPKNSELLARSIQGIAHPSGKDPIFYGYNVVQLENRVQVEITVAWTGGVLGTQYQTVVAWEISDANHVSARITSDTAMVEPSGARRELLDDYFRLKVYPAFYASISGNRG